MATAAMVDPGPTGVSRLSIIDKASAEGVHRSMARSASSRRGAPGAVGGAAGSCRAAPAPTGRPAAVWAPRAGAPLHAARAAPPPHLGGHGVYPAGREN